MRQLLVALVLVVTGVGLAGAAVAPLFEPVRTYEFELETIITPSFLAEWADQDFVTFGTCVAADGVEDDATKTTLVITGSQFEHPVTGRKAGAALISFAAAGQSGKGDDSTIITVYPPAGHVDTPSGDAYRFGSFCAASANATVVLIAIPDESVVASVRSPTVYIYDRDYPTPDTFGLAASFNVSAMAALFGPKHDVDGYGVYGHEAGGGLVFVGSPVAESYAGALYIHERNTNGSFAWGVAATIHGGPYYPGPGYPVGFGSSVSFSSDILAVGAFLTDSLVGAVFILRRSSPTSAHFVHDAVITPPPAVVPAWAQFGARVSLYAGELRGLGPFSTVLAVAMPQLVNNRGAVATYFHNATADAWVYESFITLASARPDDNFGDRLSFSKSTLLVGTPNYNQGAGLVYAYRRLTPTNTTHDPAGQPSAPSPPPVPSPPPSPPPSPSVPTPSPSPTPAPYSNYVLLKELRVPPQYDFGESSAAINLDDVAFDPSLFGSGMATFNDTAIAGAPLARIFDDFVGAVLTYVTTGPIVPDYTSITFGPAIRAAGATAASWRTTVATRDTDWTVRRLAGDAVVAAVYRVTSGGAAAQRVAIGLALLAGTPPHDIPTFVDYSNTTFSYAEGMYELPLSNINTAGHYLAYVLVGPHWSALTLPIPPSPPPAPSPALPVTSPILDYTVVAGPVTGAASLIWGSGLDPAASGSGAGSRFTVAVQARDSYGNNVTTEAETGAGVALSVVGAGVLVEDINVVYINNGRFEATYVPEVPGEYTLTVTIDTQLVLTKPVSILATCQPGTYADSATGPCLICAPGQFSDVVNADACTVCPFSTTTTTTNSSSIAACVCVVGSYSLAGAGTACVPCASLAVCDGGTTLPYPRPGAYRVDANTFIQCSPQEACLGGPDSHCAPGYGGFGCSVCADGYYRVNGKCAVCPKAAAWVFGAFILLVVVACVAFTVMSVLMARRMTKDGRSRRTTWSLASLGAAITYMQILALLGDLRSEWPSSVSRVLLAFSVANLNIELFAPECSMDSSYSTKYLFVAFVPFLLLATLAAIFAIVNAAVYVARAAGRTHSVWDNTQLRFFNRKTSVATMLTALPFLYISLTRTTLAHFNCIKREDGEWYLGGEPGRKCFDSSWWSLAPVAGAATLLYVAGIPALFAAVLFVRRNKLDKTSSLVRYGSLYRLYTDRLFYWELVQTGKKFLLVAFQLFFQSAVLFQLVLLVALFSVASLVQVRLTPFYRSLHNTLEMALNVSVWAVLFCGSVFYSERLPSGASRTIMITLTLTIVFASLAILIVSALRELAFLYALYRAGGDPDAIPSFRRDDYRDALTTFYNAGPPPSSPADIQSMAAYVSDRLRVPTDVVGLPRSNSSAAWEFDNTTDGVVLNPIAYSDDDDDDDGTRNEYGMPPAAKTETKGAPAPLPSPSSESSSGSQPA